MGGVKFKWGGILWFRLVAMKFSNPIGCHEIQQTGWMLEVRDLVGRFRLFEIFYRNWEGLNYQNMIKIKPEHEKNLLLWFLQIFYCD